ncbi:MAG TPA: peptidylprolyl isomerase [Thermoplasmataceae archaeon]|nr:peptidylprolyl isomerase [Thermoplasmatales archaeon AK]HLH85515.1 peptidylprolyl isomerase [Thermoplasmataceae archaeon]
MNDGDFIKVNFQMYVGEDKKLVSTNDEKLARENNIYDEHMKYKDTVFVVGSQDLFKEINESFRKAEVGQEYEVFIKPEDAYGVRDPKNIKVHTVREFQRQKIDPVPGQEVSIGGKRGRVISVSPGRVVVDYNHQWAGKAVLYKYKVVGVVSTEEDKVRALIDYNYHLDSSKFQVTVGDSAIEIVVPEESKFDALWIDAKFRTVNDIRKYIPNKEIRIVESYRPEEKKEDAATEGESATEKTAASDAKEAEIEQEKTQ